MSRHVLEIRNARPEDRAGSLHLFTVAGRGNEQPTSRLGPRPLDDLPADGAGYRELNRTLAGELMAKRIGSDGFPKASDELIA
jgi:hypothetical protein